MTSTATDTHPAAQWAVLVGFTPEQANCTTVVVLKILDNKCKMLPDEKQAVMAFTMPSGTLPRPCSTVLRTLQSAPRACTTRRHLTPSTRSAYTPKRRSPNRS